VAEGPHGTGVVELAKSSAVVEVIRKPAHRLKLVELLNVVQRLRINLAQVNVEVLADHVVGWLAPSQPDRRQPVGSVVPATGQSLAGRCEPPSGAGIQIGSGGIENGIHRVRRLVRVRLRGDAPRSGVNPVPGTRSARAAVKNRSVTPSSPTFSVRAVRLAFTNGVISQFRCT